MPDALLGATGFVGASLLRQHRFDAGFRSTDARLATLAPWDRVVCAAAPGQKWLANREPEADRLAVERLCATLDRLRCERFVLVSTVDVFAVPRGVDERSPTPIEGLAPYGRHRLELERFVRGRFPDATIVRLPGLVGPGLRKNALHDLRHDHEVGRIDPRGRFQFYPMVNLWADLCRLLEARVPLAHLAAEPVDVGDVAREVFGVELGPAPSESGAPPRYDVRTVLDAGFGAREGYLYDRRAVMTAIRAYALTEPDREASR